MKSGPLKYFAFVAIPFLPLAVFAQAPTIKEKIHDMERPAPRVVDPGTTSTPDAPGKPPSDAIILFDGKDFSKWQKEDGSPVGWKVEHGYGEVVPKSGSIR